ncbi:MAG TPA: hypothetical protein H9797_05720 [Candidatus Gallimonas gallistercoris]|uniref:Uncharacterized protein n=1 Tax=Candidatus Gallimonas gallistercoris TaxID=2838602 RepID=A0A9D2H3N0_9FIRM|nr:hypothetical protein [Candidatus Gallimonas gallistercoris]
MNTLQQVLLLDIEEFFCYVKSIRYGYQDTERKIHIISLSDNYADMKERGRYVFSSPEEVVKNNCGWCWDVAELIACYCEYNRIEYKKFFLEYRSSELHQTHTQIFVCHKGQWYEAPDNTSPLNFGEAGCVDAKKCVLTLIESFVAYLKSVLKEKYDEAAFLVKEVTCPVPNGISEEEYLELVRHG